MMCCVSNHHRNGFSWSLSRSLGEIIKHEDVDQQHQIFPHLTLIIILDFKMFYILTKNIIFLTRSLWIEKQNKSSEVYDPLFSPDYFPQ